MARSVCLVVKNQLWNDARVKKEARSLLSAGYEVTIVAKPEPDEQEEQIWEGVRVIRVPRDSRLRRRMRTQVLSTERSAGASSLLARLISAIRRFPPRLWLARKKGLLLFDLRMLRAALRCRADVYHANDLDTLPICRIASVIRRARLVYASHELWLESVRYLRGTSWIGRLWYRSMESLLCPAADLVIAVTRSRGDHMISRYPRMKAPLIIVENRPDPIETLPEPADLEALAGVPPSATVVLYQGIMAPERGLEQLVEAARIVREHNDDARFVLVGHSVLGDRLELLAKQMGVSDRISFLDPVPSERLMEVTVAADIGLVLFQNTCLNHYYSLPNKLYEYMMCGLPVIASELPEISSVLSEAGCGVTVDASSPRSIADGILCLCDDPDRRREMGRRGRASALSEHNWSTQRARLLEAYGEL
ncbi:glycosyltransferase family 4 protein [Candidatus Fermentibacterales bacterium]|nr:glycosyltransferase family 4 protein [Candidatus Fermentibacterales bacterium]